MKRKKTQQIEMFAAPQAEVPKAAPEVQDLTPQAEKLLANFEVLAEAEGGVKRLRELVLELAVRGRLVEQDPSEGHGEGLVTAIAQKRATLVAAGKASRLDSSSPLRPDNYPYQIPNNWSWRRFAEVTICRDGQRIPVSKDERQGRVGPYDYYGASGIIDKIDTYIFDESLLLIGEDGANLISRSTPIAFIASGKYWVNNHAHVLDGLNLDSLRYIAVFINAIDLKPYVTGTAQPKMNQAKMNSIPVAFPPLAEQKRIVAKVDELMKLCDELEARQAKQRETGARLTKSALDALAQAEGPEELATAWKRVVGNFEGLVNDSSTVASLRESILNLAVSGMLGQKDAADEPISLDFERPTNTNARSRNQKTLDGSIVIIDKSQIPTSPTHWQWARLGEVAEVVGGLAKGKDWKTTKTQLYPYLRVANVQRGYLDLGHMKDIELPENELKKYELSIGDILFTEGGDWDKLGRSAVWGGQITPCIHQNHVFRARPIFAAIDSRWISMCSNSALGRRYFENASKQTTNLASINITQLRSWPIPLPPLAEQKRIVAKVDQLMRLCDELEAQLRLAEETSRKVAEALVAELLKA